MGISVSGLKAAKIANIGGSKVDGFKRLYAKIQAQAAYNAPSIAYSDGTYVTEDGWYVDRAGSLVSAPLYSNMGLSDDNGIFIVNTAADGTGETQFTRAGDFAVDNNGILVNSAGKYLRGWALDDAGRRPGQPGNMNTVAATDFQSLEIIDLKKILTQAYPITEDKFQQAEAVILPVEISEKKKDMEMEDIGHIQEPYPVFASMPSEGPLGQEFFEQQ